MGQVRLSLKMLVVTASVVVGLASCAPKTQTVTPAPATRISVVATTIRTVPALPKGRGGAITQELSAALVDLYTRAFAASNGEVATPATPATPTPGPARRLADLFTPGARQTLAKTPGVFSPGRGLNTLTGRLAYEGVITLRVAKPVAALVKVDLDTTEFPMQASSPRARVRQIGTISLVRTAAGWRVDGFDLRLRARPAPTPSPSPS